MRACPEKTLPVLLVFLVFTNGCDGRNNHALSVSGRFEGTFYEAGSLTGGRVTSVAVDEGDTVRVGDLLVQLDARTPEARLKAASAQADQARATLAKLQTGATEDQLNQARAVLRAAEAQYELVREGARPQEHRQAAAQVNAARAQLDSARAQRDRARDLHERLATSQQQLDQAQAAFEAARAQYETATEQRNIIQEGARDKEVLAAEAHRDRAAATLAELEAGAREEDLAAARAAVAAAEAQLEAAAIQRDETQVKASGSGVVQSVDVSVGDLVQPGPLVRILADEALELVVYVTADTLGRIALGQHWPITADAHGDHPFTGTIIFIASEGEFTPRNLQTEEERAQQVFELRLRVDDPDLPLHPGMSGTVHLPNGKRPS
jgi:multidrug resistance efflux pump